MKINPFITDYQKCSQYVKDVLGVQLFPYQEIMLNALCDGLEVRVSRGIGRSFVSDLYDKKQLYGKDGCYSSISVCDEM